MATNSVLVDTSYLFALFDEKNAAHVRTALIAKIYQGRFVVPYVVLTEAAYLFRREGGTLAVVTFLDRLISMRPQLEAVSYDDLTRAREIMAEYVDSKLDFVDCCIMALSERLGITQICTLDYRDFSMFRPKHATHLEILP